MCRCALATSPSAPPRRKLTNPGVRWRTRQGVRVVNHRARAWMEFAVAFALFVAAVGLVVLMMHEIRR